MKKCALYILDRANVPYAPETQAALAETLEIIAPPMTAAESLGYPEKLAKAEILLSGWGCPRLDEAYLKLMPRLKAVFYAAGSVRGFVTEAFWTRDIVLCSAWTANAIPVAEFTLAQIILALKHTQIRSRKMHAREENLPDPISPGAYRVRVGLMGLGAIGRLVVERLKVLQIEILACDPTITEETAAQLGVRLVDLETLFTQCQVVSLHAPLLDSTFRMITGAHFHLLPRSATFINTSRGAIVREEEMIAALQARPDLTALLDVTEHEPLETDSPLHAMSNVFLTPHIAGSMGNECWRMGDYMLEEIRSYLRGAPLQWQLTRNSAELMA